MKNKVSCQYCNNEIYIDRYLVHLKENHESFYLEFINKIIEMNNKGYTINEIAKELNFTEEIIFNSLEYSRQKSPNIKSPLRISQWEPKNFKLETDTTWSFPNRGDWATHNNSYRGNWSPYIPRNIILRYSKENDIVLDQFVGSGTTLIETKLLRRKGIGVDINEKALILAKENTRFKRNEKYNPILYHEDARTLEIIGDNTIDLICTHPPYANIIKYSQNINGDLSLLHINDFIKEMGNVAKECYRVLKKNKYCVILIGDTRQNKHMIPLGFKVMQKFLESGFLLKETIVKKQHNCKATEFWYKKSIEYNFLLISHEYLFIFRKP